MKTIQRNGINFFPNGVKNVWILLFDYYFQPLKCSSIYRVTKKDFGTKTITAVNVENAEDIITLDFHTPVNHLKTY